MNYNSSSNRKRLRRASSNLIKIYDSALAKVNSKVTKISTLRNIHKFDKKNILDLLNLLVLDRITFHFNIKKLIKKILVSHKFENNNKLIGLTTICKNKFREITFIWEETQCRYT